MKYRVLFLCLVSLSAWSNDLGITVESAQVETQTFGDALDDNNRINRLQCVITLSKEGIEQGQCERCAALERENETLRKRLAVYDKYRDLLKDSHLEGIIKKMMNVQGELLNQKATKYAGVNGLARLSEAQASVSDRLFAQTLTLFELPAKTEQTKVKTENIRARTAQVKADTRW